MNRRATLLLGFMILAVASVPILAAETVDVLVFYREGCNDCRHMDAVLEDLQALYPQLVVRHIEEGEPDAGLMWTLATKYGIFPAKFPVIYVGDEAIVGSGRDKELRLRTAIRDCVHNGCASPLASGTETAFPWRTALIGGLIVLAVVLLLLP